MLQLRNSMCMRQEHVQLVGLAEHDCTRAIGCNRTRGPCSSIAGTSTSKDGHWLYAMRTACVWSGT